MNVPVFIDISLEEQVKIWIFQFKWLLKKLKCFKIVNILKLEKKQAINYCFVLYEYATTDSPSNQ